MLALQQICRTRNAKAQPAHNDEICVQIQLTAIDTSASCVHEHDGSGRARRNLKSCSIASDALPVAAAEEVGGASEGQPRPSRVRLMLTVIGSAAPRTLAPNPPSYVAVNENRARHGRRKHLFLPAHLLQHRESLRKGHASGV